MRIRTSVVAMLLALLVIAGSVEAQTVVNPTDTKMIVRFSAGSTGVYTSVFYAGLIPPSFDLRVFFEFDLSGYGPASAAVFNFSGYPVYTVTGYSAATLFLAPMTSGEDGTVTTGDFSLLGSPIWSTIVTFGASSFSFSVPVTSWFNNRAGGYGGFALVTGMGGAYTINAPGASLDYTAVPEPGTIALFGIGLASLCIGHRVRRRRSRS